MLDLNRSYKLKQGIVLKSVNDKYWALSTSNGNQYKLNEIAYYILNELTNEKSIQTIIDLVAKEYKVSKEDFKKDCNVMIESAVKNTLIEEVNK